MDWRPGRPPLGTAAAGLAALGRELAGILFPWRCPFCGRGGAGLHHPCPPCLAALAIDPSWRCLSCGHPLPEPGGGLCHREPHPPLDGLLAAAGYGEPMRRAVHLFKYAGRAPAGRTLGQLMVEALESRIDFPCDLVVPVPLSRSRLRERGFNQSALLARDLGRALSRPVACRLLERSGGAGRQALLGNRERRSNIAGAFRLRRPRDASGSHILLVDDVYTTGATMNECAGVLKSAGAALVFGAVLACAARKDADPAAAN